MIEVAFEWRHPKEVEMTQYTAVSEKRSDNTGGKRWINVGAAREQE
jgi:hypothetical protein